MGHRYNAPNWPVPSSPEWMPPQGCRPDSSWSTAREGCNFRTWDPSVGVCEATLVGHDGEVTGCAFSPDGQRLISTSLDGSLSFWSVVTGREVAVAPDALHPPLRRRRPHSSSGGLRQQLGNRVFRRSARAAVGQRRGCRPIPPGLGARHGQADGERRRIFCTACGERRRDNRPRRLGPQVRSLGTPRRHSRALERPPRAAQEGVGP